MNLRTAQNLVSGYDIVITSQAQFDAMIASPTWLDAQSVLIVGGGGSGALTDAPAGSYCRTASITIPATVKKYCGY